MLVIASYLNTRDQSDFYQEFTISHRS